MGSRIKILPEGLINRIAAGEVIERPASIVKELIDNSIDAGSTEVNVSLAEGGKSFISVSDNGEGMTPEDAVLAFERYATSKLASEEDLTRISTMGFRGEALPSIAAVSRIHLTTKTREEAGVELILEEGKVFDKKEAGRGTGTEIEVSRLFSGFPARKKFLRSASTELAYITSILNQMALAHFHIGFGLTHQGKKVLNYPAVRNLRERLFQVYGEEVMDQIISLEKEDDTGFSLEGFISLPPHSYGSRSHQELFVNKRPVKNPMISHAVYEAYQSFLMKGQNPFYLFLLEIEPSRVDVNVHPAKKEVRFSDSSGIYRRVLGKIRDALDGRSPLRPRVFASGGTESPSFNQIRESPGKYVVLPVPANDKLLQEERSPDLFREIETGTEPYFKVFGQFNAMFLVVQEGEELQIIDQHAAHERILFERFLTQYSEAPMPVQPLLIPRQVDFTPGDLLVLQEHEKLFIEMGFEFEVFGEKTLLIRSVPPALSNADLFSLLSDMIEEIRLFEGISSGKEKIEKIIATMACHAAVKAGRSLEISEITALFKDLLKLKRVLTCPHGRPIRKAFSVRDLEKLFYRI